jgi:hypothetical protein
MLALPLLAADLNGKWAGTVNSPDGAEQVSLELKVTGAAVEGTIGPDAQKRLPIEKGHFEGDVFHFEISSPDGANISCDLTLQDDSLKGPCKRTADGKTENGTFDLKRV